MQTPLEEAEVCN